MDSPPVLFELGTELAMRTSRRCSSPATTRTRAATSWSRRCSRSSAPRRCTRSTTTTTSLGGGALRPDVLGDPEGLHAGPTRTGGLRRRLDGRRVRDPRGRRVGGERRSALLDRARCRPRDEPLASCRPGPSAQALGLHGSRLRPRSSTRRAAAPSIPGATAEEGLGRGAGEARPGRLAGGEGAAARAGHRPGRRWRGRGARGLQAAARRTRGAPRDDPRQAHAAPARRRINKIPLSARPARKNPAPVGTHSSERQITRGGVDAVRIWINHLPTGFFLVIHNRGRSRSVRASPGWPSGASSRCWARRSHCSRGGARHHGYRLADSSVHCSAHRSPRFSPGRSCSCSHPLSTCRACWRWAGLTRRLVGCGGDGERQACRWRQSIVEVQARAGGTRTTTTSPTRSRSTARETTKVGRARASRSRSQAGHVPTSARCTARTWTATVIVRVTRRAQARPRHPGLRDQRGIHGALAPGHLAEGSGRRSGLRRGDRRARGARGLDDVPSREHAPVRIRGATCSRACWSPTSWRSRPACRPASRPGADRRARPRHQGDRGGRLLAAGACSGALARCIPPQPKGTST